MIIDKDEHRLKIIKEEATFEETQMLYNYNSDISKVNEEIMRIKNQIIAFKKKKDTFASQIDNLMEIYKEKAG